MFIDNYFIVPSAVVAVVPEGKNGSKGCVVWLSSGGVIALKRPTTEVVAILGVHSGTTR